MPDTKPGRRFNWRIRTRPLSTLLIILLFGILPIAALGAFAYRLTAQSTRKLIASNNYSSALLTRDLIRTEFEHRINTLRGFAANPGFVTAVGAHDETTVRDRMRVLVESQPRVERAFVADLKGTIWSDYPEAPESLGHTFDYRDWYHGVSAGWQPYISNVYRRNASPQVLLLAVAVPVLDADGDPMGVIVYQIRLEHLSSLLRHAEVGDEGYTFLLDFKGVVAAHPLLDLQSREYTEYAETEPVAKASGDATSGLLYNDPLSGVEMLATAIPFEITGHRWTVVSQQPVARAYAPLRVLAWQITAGGTFIAALLIAGIALLAAYQERLRQANERLDAANLELAQENRERRRSFGTLLSNLPGMVYRCKNDPNWTIEFASEGCKALTGYPPDALIGNRDRAYADLINPEDRDRVWEIVQDAIEENESYTMTYRIISANGEEKWVWERGRGVVDEDGNLLALEGFISDITEQKSLELQLIQAQRMEAVGRLAGGIAHDFNNMLTVINGYSSMMLEDIDASSPLKADLEEVNRAGERASSLTRQLLAFSRRQVLKPEVLNLNEVVTGMDKMLRRLIGENINLVARLHPRLDSVEFDPGQIEQIIMNLVINARDAMPEGGKLTIETGNVELDEAYARSHTGVTEGPHVMLAIVDNGSGMDAETRSRIFEPFYTTKERGKGTGLGLSTVYGIVHQSGGDIWVYSEPGRGTTFKVYLPRAGRAGKSERTPAKEPAQPGRGETVLIVEDDDAVRGLIRSVLEKNGYRVLDTGDVEEALDLINRNNGDIHVMLTDLVMPKFDGFELARRATESRPGLKVIYMSGYTDDAIERSDISRQEVAFIEKPVGAKQLLETLRNVLK